MLVPLDMLNQVWHAMNQYRMFSVEISPTTPSMHRNLLNMESIVCKTTNS